MKNRCYMHACIAQVKSGSKSGRIYQHEFWRPWIRLPCSDHLIENQASFTWGTAQNSLLWRRASGTRRLSKKEVLELDLDHSPTRMRPYLDKDVVTTTACIEGTD